MAATGAEHIERGLIRDGIPTVVDLPQTAAILRVSARTVRCYRAENRLRSVYPRGSGQQIVFLRSEIARFLSNPAAE